MRESATSDRRPELLVAIPRNAQPFLHLMAFRVAVESIPRLTPTATIGGELVQARFLTPHLVGRESVIHAIVRRFTGAWSAAADSSVEGVTRCCS